MNYKVCITIESDLFLKWKYFLISSNQEAVGQSSHPTNEVSTNKISTNEILLRCINLGDDSCNNGALPGSGKDDDYLIGNGNPGKRSQSNGNEHGRRLRFGRLGKLSQLNNWKLFLGIKFNVVASKYSLNNQ